LAAGRVLGLLLLSLLTFWGASLHLLPLHFVPPLVYIATFSGAIFALTCTLGRARSHTEFWEWLLAQRAALLTSDLIFLGAFGFFVWLRCLHPVLNEFEKPMDSAIIGTLTRTDFLPAENPWFAGMPFTNYYYFGHFMGALLLRSLGGPLPYAYNLIQPAFCAFFLSVFWSLVAAFCRSNARGALVMAIVTLCGNFEPLRQWLFASPNLNRSAAFPFLNWWSTSRVIEGTINEYPFFTLALGDAHAHFFALAITSLVLCSCLELLVSLNKTISTSLWKEHRILLLLCLLAAALGALLMTNAWDFPVYLLLAITCLTIGAMRRKETTSASLFFVVLLLVFLSLLTAIPFLAHFKSQTGGFALEFWLPENRQFLLIWGAFLGLWTMGLLLGTTAPNRKWALLALALLLMGTVSAGVLLVAQIVLIVATITELRRRVCEGENHCAASSRCFVLILASCGLLALLAPQFGYLKGYFGGALRHQDTVFKFGLQSWMLLGTAAIVGVFGWQSRSIVQKSLQITVVLWLIPLCCSLSLIVARIETPPRTLSLNGSDFLPRQDQQAIAWLARNASAHSVLIEPVGRDANGEFVGAYGRYGLISALTGIPDYVGWPQHARFWGAPNAAVERRLAWAEALYQGSATTLPSELLKAHPTLYCYSSTATAVLPPQAPQRDFVLRPQFRAGDATLWKIETRRR
jgi:YYY domain-containing protein